MLVGELKKRFEGVPDDAHIYLDDTVMATPLGLVEVRVEECNAVKLDTNEWFKMCIVTLTTYPSHKGDTDVSE